MNDLVQYETGSLRHGAFRLWNVIPTPMVCKSSIANGEISIDLSSGGESGEVRGRAEAYNVGSLYADV